MVYPVEILPAPNKVSISDFANCYLIRHTDFENIWNHDIDLIKEEAICSPRSNMPDLSSSLLGVFNEAHTKIKVLNKDFNEYCKPDYTASVPVFPTDFTIVTGRSYWLLKIEELDNEKVEYKMGDDSFDAFCKVRHTPMKWNYFHLSVNWFLPQEDKFWHELDEKEKKQKWSKDRLSSLTRSALKAKIENIRISDI